MMPPSSTSNPPVNQGDADPIQIKSVLHQQSALEKPLLSSRRSRAEGIGPQKLQRNDVRIKRSNDGDDEIVPAAAAPVRPTSVGGPVTTGHHQTSGLQSAQHRQPKVILNRKRPAQSDPNTTDPSSRAGSHAKLEHQSLENRDHSLPYPEPASRTYKSRNSHHQAASAERVFANLRLGSSNGSRASGNPASPATGANLPATKSKFFGDQRKGLSTLAENPPQGFQKTSGDHIQTFLTQPCLLQKDSVPPFQEEEDEDGDEHEELQFNQGLTKQPNSRPISIQQLGAEVKGIYSGLVMVENKCINVIRSQSVPTEDSSSAKGVDQLQTLIALHRTLLHEHHDFFLASQHPSANVQIRGLAARYSMPARMWKHGIHSFLELLRHRLPESMDYMLAFIYIAYQMIALLYETVPSFEDTWIECLGDLARYRMAIEDENLVDRDVWTGVARSWYLKALDKNPGTGRLYHHLAILARKNALNQLALYCDSLVAITPFLSTRDSIITLIEPSLARIGSTKAESMSLDDSFVALHAMLFTQTSLERFHSVLDQFRKEFGTQFDASQRITKRQAVFGEYLAIANISSLLQYGQETSHILSLFIAQQKSEQSSEVSSDSEDSGSQSSVTEHEASDEVKLEKTSLEWQLTLTTFTLILQWPRQPNLLRHVHVMLAFFWRLSILDDSYLADKIPWDLLKAYLNQLLPERSSKKTPKIFADYYKSNIENDSFPIPDKGDCRQLPEDYLIRGQKWASGYFPEDWFANATSDEEERMMERPSTSQQRIDRVLWLAVRLALVNTWMPSTPEGQAPPEEKFEGHGKWLRWRPEPKLFSVSSRFADTRQAQVTPSSWNSAQSAEADRGGADPRDDGGSMSGVEGDS